MFLPGMPFLAAVKDYNINLVYVRIRRTSGPDIAASIVINRWHDNVAYLFGESGALDASKDTADILPELIGSYPNYFFDVREDDAPDFFDLLAHYENGAKDLERMARYGVNRSDERLWDTYDWFQARFSDEEPVAGGLLDLNRYDSTAR